jgi:hypothetical protein
MRTDGLSLSEMGHSSRTRNITNGSPRLGPSTIEEREPSPITYFDSTMVQSSGVGPETR